MNYRLKIQYDGYRFKGWQRQPGTDMTIQGKLEAVLSCFVGEVVTVDGAGRTDAGVHALEQVANVKLAGESADVLQIRDYLNEYLPEDIRVSSVECAGERFHSRLNATGKRYAYHIMKSDCENVFLRKYTWKAEKPLDIKQMVQAARCFYGSHDFRSFCTNPAKKKSTVRKIESITIEETETELILRFCGNGFLHHMVRILTGTLVEVGSGARKPEEIPGILEKRERKYAGVMAPAQGLFLEKVFYD